MYKKSMSNIYSLTFNSNDWEKVKDSPTQIIWEASPFETIIEEFKQPTDFKRDALDPDMRLELEEIAKQNGGALIDFQTSKIKELEVVKQIYKFWYPEPQDMRKIYIGTYAFPFADFCYILKIQCIESGTTGAREAAVAVLLPKNPTETKRESIFVKSFEEMLNHMKKSPVTRTISDDEKYDALLPNHPLSRVRWYLKHFADTLMVSPDLQKAKPYRVNKSLWF